MAQVLPVLTLSSVMTGAQEGDSFDSSDTSLDTTAKLPLMHTGENKSTVCKSDCSTTPSNSGRDEDSDCPDRSSDDEATICSACSASSRTTTQRIHWADIEDSDDDLCMPSTSEPVASEQKRTPLKSSAQVYVTAEVKATQRVEFGKIVAAGLLALRSCPLVVSSDVQELAGGGWNLNCCLHDGIFDQVAAYHAISMQVQTAILQAANVSNNVYVLGYELDPFQNTSLGFSFRMAEVHDDTMACWDLITKGYCTRGNSCRWQHPAEQVSVAVNICCM